MKLFSGPRHFDPGHQPGAVVAICLADRRMQAQWVLEEAEVEHAPIKFRVGGGVDAE